jgi:hypothetical protein
VSETPESVIPPFSEVKVIKGAEGQLDWAGQEGRLFRVGYYRKRDGLERVWLVDEEGNYCKAVDQEMIKTHFEVVTTSSVTDLFGVNGGPAIQAIPLVSPTPWDRMTRQVAVVLLLCALPVAVAFGIHGNFVRGAAAELCTFIFLATIWLRWDLSGKFWFWITLCLLAIAHVRLLLFVPAGGQRVWIGPYGYLVPALADFAVIYGPIRLIETVIAKRSRTSRLPQDRIPGV